jgi:uncharacterized protein YegP (UPF0339 family)
MDNPKFVLFRGSDKQFYFRLQAANGKPILQSSGYTKKDSAHDGIASVKENASDGDRYDRRESSDDQCYFVLLAANNEIIGTSEMYKTTGSREDGIAAVVKTAPTAPADDQTK